MHIRTIIAIAALMLGSTVSAQTDFSGVAALAGRLGGNALTEKLNFAEWSGETSEKAQIIPGDGAFTIKATSVHLAAVALGVYLREVAHGHISWCGKRLPAEWPVPATTIDVATRYPYAMAYNYCTLSYTMAYWGKEAWQNEIDRLALSGYSQALVMAGVQKIWSLTMQQLGYTEQQRHDFIVDDAVQAWWLMGNLQALGDGTEAGHYPIVTDEQIETDAEIGQFIVRQMRAVGIEPILQGFIGLIPSSTTVAQIAEKLGYEASDTTKVQIFRNGDYVAGQKNPDLLDPTCEAFKMFSDTWNANLKTVYGMTDAADYPKFLGGDLFHESSPPSSMTTEQKVNCAKFVQQYQQNAFPGVTWVLQSWQGSPDQNLRNGLNPAHTIIQYLDQTMSATDARVAGATFHNQTDNVYLPYVWVEVMNFGGNTGMHGAFRRFRNVGTLGEGSEYFRGYGLLSEGLETNPVSYDLYNSRFTETTKETQNIDDSELQDWLEAYRLRRYGYTDDNLKAAQTICANTVWTCTRDQQGTIESVFCANPGYSITSVSAWGPTTGTPYDRNELVKAAKYMLAAAQSQPALLDLETFRYDFVEIFQQLLADRAREILPECAASKPRRDSFRRMLGLLDSILACSDEWRLDRKEARVTPKAGAAARAAYRRMITTWTPGARGQTQLSQYAHRSYAGLVKHYHAVKWNAFFDLADGLTTQAAYNTLCRDLDRDFPSADLEATPTDGDPVSIAEAILAEISPKSFTWTGAAGDNTFEGANWQRDGQTGNVNWEDEGDATIAASKLTITAGSAVAVGDMTVVPSASVKSYDTGYISASTPVATGWTGLTLAELARDYRLTGTMNGGWVAEGEAEGYCHTFNEDGTALTAQMQKLDGGFLKAVALQFTVNNDEIYVKALWVRNRNDKAIGDNLASLGNSTGSPAVAESDDAAGYGIKSLALRRGELTLAGGPYAIRGTLHAPNCTLAFPGGATIANLKLAGGKTMVLALPTSGELAVNAVELGAGASLALAGDWIDSTRIKLPRTLLAAATYTDSEGRPREFSIDSEGYIHLKTAPHSYSSDYISATDTATGWTDLTLAELATCEFTGKMNGGYINGGPINVHGYQIAMGENELKVQLQAVNDSYTKAVTLVFTVNASGEICVRAEKPSYADRSALGTDISSGNGKLATDDDAEGYGIKSFAIAAAGVRIAETGANYSSLMTAVAAAKGDSLSTTKTIEIYGDIAAEAFGDGDGNYPVKLQIAASGNLTAPAVDDFLYWNKAWALDVYGTLDLGAYSLSFGPSYSQSLTFRPGSHIIFTSGRGISVFETATLTFPDDAEDARPAIIDAALQLRKTTTAEVAAGATAIINGDLLDKGSQGGDAHVEFAKSGDGRLELNGSIMTGAISVRATAGVLARSLKANESFVLTLETGATAEIASADPDYKIEIAQAGSVHTYTSVPRVYLFRVTEPGNISVNQAGVNYESFTDALAAAKALQKANPASEVKIWIYSASVIEAAMAKVEAYNAANDTKITQFGDGNGNEIKGWRLLIWNYDKTFWEPTNGTDTHGNRGQAYLDGTLVNICADDIVVFDRSQTSCIYIEATRQPRIRLNEQVAVNFGVTANTHNLPENSTVELAAGSQLTLSNYSRQGEGRIKSSRIDGPGIVTVDTAKLSSINIEATEGTAEIHAPDGVTFKVAGATTTPLVLKGMNSRVTAPSSIAQPTVRSGLAGKTVKRRLDANTYSYFLGEKALMVIIF